MLINKMVMNKLLLVLLFNIIIFANIKYYNMCSSAISEIRCLILENCEWYTPLHKCIFNYNYFLVFMNLIIILI